MQEDVEALQAEKQRAIHKVRLEIQRVYSSGEVDSHYLQVLHNELERHRRVYDMCTASLIAKAPAPNP